MNALLAGTSMAASAAGATIAAQGAEQGGQAQSSAYTYQAGIATLDKKIAAQNADYALTTGEVQAEQYGIKAGQRMGSIKAGQGASGLDVGGGSETQVRQSQQEITEIDNTQIRANAARRAYGADVTGAEEGLKADLYTKASADALQAGKIKARGSLISGVGAVADKWMQFNSSFGTGGLGLGGGSGAGAGVDPAAA